MYIRHEEAIVYIFNSEWQNDERIRAYAGFSKDLKTKKQEVIKVLYEDSDD